MDMDWVTDCNKMCSGILRPQLNIFIDVPPEVCMQRIQANREAAELYENGEILKKVRANYLAAFDRLKPTENIAVINGNRDINDVAGDVWGQCAALFPSE